MFGSVLNVDKVKLAGSKYPKDPKHSFTYGTAGFRMRSFHQTFIYLDVVAMNFWIQSCFEWVY